MNNTGKSSTAILYITHVSILIVGFSIGLLAAYVFILIPFDFSSELRKARALGIVSVSILQGYPKSKDVVSYFSLLFFPVSFSIVPWYLWARNRTAVLREMFSFADTTKTETNQRTYLYVIILLLVGVLWTFNITDFYDPNFKPFVGSWPFLGEDGENLAWVQSILSGGVYGKDFFCLYGPLLIYPLAWAMKLFGQTVCIERALKYCYDLVAFGLVVFFLFKTFRFKWLALFASLLYLVLFPPYWHLSVNLTTLRFVLGIVPFLLLHFYRSSGKRKLLFLAGIVVGLSILFSQEAGIASLVICVSVFFLDDVLRQGKVRTFSINTAILLSGLVLAVTPMLIFFAAKGALVMFFDSIYGFPKLKTLGYGSFPFPSLHEFIAKPLGVFPLAYWMIFFYGGMSIYLAVLFLLKSGDKTLYLKMALLLYGIILFRIPLGRVALEDAMKVFPSTLLLFFLQIDCMTVAFLNHKKLDVRIGYALFALLVIGSFSIVVLYGTNVRYNIVFMADRLRNFSQKLTVLPIGVELPGIERGKIFYDPSTANSIVKIKNFLDTYAQEERYVYFFPNEAAYYFIFNKQNPTRYAIAYFAATSSQRLDLISGLERNKPRFIIYSLDTWRIDGIPETTQVPEVVDYMKQKYETLGNLGEIVILQRKQIERVSLFLPSRPGLCSAFLAISASKKE
jgi:hypothetical protein